MFLANERHGDAEPYWTHNAAAQYCSIVCLRLARLGSGVQYPTQHSLQDGEQNMTTYFSASSLLVLAVAYKFPILYSSQLRGMGMRNSTTSTISLEENFASGHLDPSDPLFLPVCLYCSIKKASVTQFLDWLHSGSRFLDRQPLQLLTFASLLILIKQASFTKLLATWHVMASHAFITLRLLDPKPLEIFSFCFLLKEFPIKMFSTCRT